MRKVLYVSPHGTQWKVHWQGETEGKIFDRKEEAIRHARNLIGSLPEGATSEIRVQRADGTFQTEWTYGKDPFPPRG
jgi:hypothetical protein